MLDARMTDSEERSRSQSALILEVRGRLREINSLIATAKTTTEKVADSIELGWLRRRGSELKLLMQRIFAINVATYKAVLVLQAVLPSHLERLLIQEPFILEDAIGRISPLHMKFISSWEAFDSVLEIRFQKVQGYQKVKSKESHSGARDKDARSDEICRGKSCFRYDRLSQLIEPGNGKTTAPLLPLHGLGGILQRMVWLIQHNQPLPPNKMKKFNHFSNLKDQIDFKLFQ
jgi:hypothetical protein